MGDLFKDYTEAIRAKFQDAQYAIFVGVEYDWFPSDQMPKTVPYVQDPQRQDKLGIWDSLKIKEWLRPKAAYAETHHVVLVVSHSDPTEFYCYDLINSCWVT
jgi:hypothetical protein